MGGGIGMGNTCKSMADSFQRMTKPTTIKKKKKKKKMTVRADCAVSECSSPSPSIKDFAHCLSGEEELAFEQESTLLANPTPLPRCWHLK